MQHSLTRLLQKSSVLMGARLPGGVLAFAVNIMIARWFGADVLGQFALAMALASLVAVFLPTGLQSIAMLFVSRYVAEQQTGDARAFIKTGYRRIGVLSALAAGCFAVGFAVMRGHIEEQTLQLAGIACLTAPALALLNFNCGVLTGLKQQMLGLLPDLIVKPALMFTAVLALALTASSRTSITVMIVVCACMWVTAIGQVFVMKRTVLLPATVAGLSAS